MAAQVDKRRLACSIWTNSNTGWGVRILGATAIRQKHFERSRSPVLVDVDGIGYELNIDKDSFWTGCGELIHKSIRGFKDAHHLKAGDRVWLEIVEPQRRFRLEMS